MAIAIMTARHSRIIENGQKGEMWVKLVAETKRHSGHSSQSTCHSSGHALNYAEL